MPLPACRAVRRTLRTAIRLAAPGAYATEAERLTGRLHETLRYDRVDDYGDAAPVRWVYWGHAGQQLFVDVGVRPALDDDGQEHPEETAAALRDQTLVEAAPEQQQQQQQ